MKELLMATMVGAYAVTASAQGMQPRRTLGNRLARPAQTVSLPADAAKDREARKARAAQRPQFSAGSSAVEFERECETLFMDIVREAEICQTNLAEYATYPYWPDAMGVVSNFCEKEGCMVVDAGHHFGTWRQGCGKKAYVATSDFDRHRQFVPRVQSDEDGGFRLVSRGGAYTNVACRYVGPISCYDAEGRFEGLYDSLDKLPRMQDCLNADVKRNYAEQDRWMKAHGFSDEGGGREAERNLDAARTNAISRLESLRTILSKFPHWNVDNKWYRVCDVGAELRGPSASGSYRPRLGGLRSPASGINTNDVVFARMNERFLSLGRNQDRLIEEVVSSLTGLEFGSSGSTNRILDLKFNLGSYESCTFARAPDSGVVSSVTLIAEFDRYCEQKTILEKLDQGLSVLLSAIGMDRDALAYNESQKGVRGVPGGLLRPAVNQGWDSVQSLSRRFLISRGRQQTGEYVVTISAQKNVAMPTSGGGSLRARRLQRQREAQAAVEKQQEAQAAREAERQAQEELKKLAAAVKSKYTASCGTKKPTSEKLRQCDFLLNKDFKKGAKFYLCLFSASWCPPCRAEMPRIAKTYAETLKDDPDIELIHFSRDQNDEKALAWAKEHDVKFPVVKPNGGNPLELRCNGIPHLFIVKADGTLLEEGHPMRIFNADKFSEIKSGNVKPQAVDFKLKDGERTEQVDGYTWTYRVENGGATIVAAGGKRRCTITPSPKGSVAIPSKLGGMDVTKIGSEAFCGCSGITSVTFPASVKEICWRAFSKCDTLTSVSIPSGVIRIDPSAFSGCRSMTAITVSEENAQYVSMDGVVFDKSMTTLVCYPSGIPGEYAIPEGVMCIGRSAFSAWDSRYSGLSGVKIPDSVKTVGDYSFDNCQRLTEVVLGKGVTTIGSCAFRNCDGLTSIRIPKNVVKIDHSAFIFCSGLKEFVVDPNNPKFTAVNGMLLSKDGSELLAGVDGDVLVPDGVKSIGSQAFCQYSGLTSVKMPSSLTDIGDSSFYSCAELTSITIPANVKRIGRSAFDGCRSLTSVTMCGERPESPNDVFSSCDELKSIHVPANAKSWAGMTEWQGIPLVFDAESQK